LNVPEEPKVFLIDVPWLGGGVEMAVLFGLANYAASWQTGDWRARVARPSLHSREIRVRSR
jgi:hypothetical protein